ncbi:MAG: ImmA/IrrE family metallo-endopeptidase [Coprobacillus sp.]|nr:ImmA/IrrE family metallo-endopeptidase [Coprobacillus sp.]
MVFRDYILLILCDIYEQSGIFEPGFDLFKFLKKMGVVVVPYSSILDTNLYKNILKKRKDGASTIFNNTPIIFYNDAIKSEARIKTTLCHEYGHIALGHYQMKNYLSQYTKEKQARLFAIMFYTPFALLWHYSLYSTEQIEAAFKISTESAYQQSERMIECLNSGYRLDKYDERLLEIFLNNQKIAKGKNYKGGVID